MTCEEYAKEPIMSPMIMVNEQRGRIATKKKQGGSDLSVSSGMDNQQLASSNKPTQTNVMAATCIAAHN